MGGDQQTRVLIVDDDVINLQTLGNSLEKANHEVMIANNGKLALEIVQSGKPDIILLDIVMPEMDGYAVCRRIRKHYPPSEIPIIFLTAETDAEFVVEGFSAGGSDFISKPVDLGILLARVNTQLQLARYQWTEKQEKQNLEDRVRARTLELEHSLQMLQKEKKAKDDFMATMSHELRTPLASILGFCEILSDEVKEPEHLEYLSQIRSSGENQLALVNDILDICKVDSGNLDLHEGPYSLSLLLDEVHGMLSHSVSEKGLELTIEQKNRAPNILIGDSQRIKQILLNLVSNGIKFTEKGGVSLTTDVTDNQLQFVVSDTGIGIQPENMNRLFKRFEQLDGAINRRFGGAGLGLYIAKQFTDLMGGTLTATSEYGHGSTFVLRLPYHTTDESDGGRIEAETTTQPHRSPMTDHFVGHILLAEDISAIQTLVKRMMETLGIAITLAENGKEAVEMVKQHRFDLVLMDMQMPVMDGLEATRQIKAGENPIPVIALTANVMQKHREAFIAAGCNDFLEKPINRELLIKTLSKYLPIESMKS